MVVYFGGNMTRRDYKYSESGICLERETHYSSDGVEYYIIIKNQQSTLFVSITKTQFDNLKGMNIPSYRHDYTPEGLKVEPFITTP